MGNSEDGLMTSAHMFYPLCGSLTVRNILRNFSATQETAPRDSDNYQRRNLDLKSADPRWPH